MTRTPAAPPGGQMPTQGELDWMAVSANASGGFHLYLVDSKGRKIAALWGGAEEKQANAERIVALWNTAAKVHP